MRIQLWLIGAHNPKPERGEGNERSGLHRRDVSVQRKRALPRSAGACLRQRRSVSSAVGHHWVRSQTGSTFVRGEVVLAPLLRLVPWWSLGAAAVFAIQVHLLAASLR
jgi:hypothetical protein